MAQNWNVKEAMVAINKREKESIIDIGHRFPLSLNLLSHIIYDPSVVEFINALPEHITLRKIETTLKGVECNDSTEEVVTGDNIKDVEDIGKEVKPEAKKNSTKSEYSQMTGDELITLLKNAGVYKDCKEKMGGAKKQQMIDYIEKYGLKVEESNESNESNETNPYAGKTAMELFKECKARGLEAKPKQKAAFYVDILLKDDQSKTVPADDWDEEEKTPIDDDDDWDI